MDDNVFATSPIHDKPKEPDEDVVAELERQSEALSKIELNPSRRRLGPSAQTPISQEGSNSKKSFDIIRPSQTAKKLKIDTQTLPKPVAEKEEINDSGSDDNRQGPDALRSELNEEEVKESASGSDSDVSDDTDVDIDDEPKIIDAAEVEDEDFSESLPGFIEDEDETSVDSTDSKEYDSQGQSIKEAEDPRTSFATQLQQTSATDDEEIHHNPFDTEQYHQPLLPAHISSSKSHKLGWLLFTVFLIGLIIGIVIMLRQLRLL